MEDGSCRDLALWMNESADTAEMIVLEALPSLWSFVKNSSKLVTGSGRHGVRPKTSVEKTEYSSHTLEYWVHDEVDKDD